MRKKKRKSKDDVVSTELSSATARRTLRPPVTRKQIDRLRGRFKGNGLLQALAQEKREEKRSS